MDIMMWMLWLFPEKKRKTYSVQKMNQNYKGERVTVHQPMESMLVTLSHYREHAGVAHCIKEKVSSPVLLQSKVWNHKVSLSFH